MQGVAGVTERIAVIQERISQLSAPSTSGAAFDSLLGTAILNRTTATTPTTATPPPAITSGSATTQAAAVGSGLGGVDSKHIPIELKAYGNGRIPKSALSPIAGTDHELWAPAARSFEAMRGE